MVRRISVYAVSFSPFGFSTCSAKQIFFPLDDYIIIFLVCRVFSPKRVDRKGKAPLCLLSVGASPNEGELVSPKSKEREMNDDEHGEREKCSVQRRRR